ncbi:hypothetical protein KFU94_33555 [Chloroflexi bacterium TSY]|nr:hypothetical protein [Chloroflexi bacterium TSY]
MTSTFAISLSVGLLLTLSTQVTGVFWTPSLRSQQQQNEPPYPLSQEITSITWEPIEEIERVANGSDNWPITWGADDQLYTAYGDGQGFEQQAPEKLSLGFAAIDGPPSEFYGTNIESDGEQRGDGRAGKKASSLLMIEDRLYMWVRNVDGNGHGCQLAWSDTEATTWEWVEWTFPEFGYVFLFNMGQIMRVRAMIMFISHRQMVQMHTSQPITLS